MATLFVGNLPYQTSDRELRDLFNANFGVKEARIVRDSRTGDSKGFGFVELMTDEEAERAIEELKGARMRNRPIRVELAKGRLER